MPPRYVYWTILIDGKATAFRAREREELLPTFNQLARKNAAIEMRYFARGRLWDNPEQAQWASRNMSEVPTEKRSRGWRPGGEHKDPRARFTKTGDRRDRPAPPKSEQHGELPRPPFRKTSNRHERPFSPKAEPRRESRAPFTKTGARRERPLPPRSERPRDSRAQYSKTTDRRERPLPPHREQQRDSRAPYPKTTDQRERPLPPKAPSDQQKTGPASERRPFPGKDRREPRFDARTANRPGRSSGPPKRKPR